MYENRDERLRWWYLPDDVDIDTKGKWSRRAAFSFKFEIYSNENEYEIQARMEFQSGKNTARKNFSFCGREKGENHLEVMIACS